MVDDSNKDGRMGFPWLTRWAAVHRGSYQRTLGLKNLAPAQSISAQNLSWYGEGWFHGFREFQWLILQIRWPVLSAYSVKQRIHLFEQRPFRISLHSSAILQCIGRYVTGWPDIDSPSFKTSRQLYETTDCTRAGLRKNTQIPSWEVQCYVCKHRHSFRKERSMIAININ